MQALRKTKRDLKNLTKFNKDGKTKMQQKLYVFLPN